MMNVTRRTFLGAMGAAGTALALGGRGTPGRAAEKPDLVVAFISDTHLAIEGRGDASKRMADMVAEINASPAELVICLGDLVDTGPKHEPQYAEWMKIAKGLARPFYAVPGNHDSVEFFRKYVRPETDYVVDQGGYRFVLFLDVVPPSHDGSITAAQLEWIAARVDEAARAKRRVILCAHVTRHPNQAPDIAWYVKTQEKEFAALLEAKRGTILAMFSGHLHYGLRGWNDTAGVLEMVIPSACWNAARDLSKAPGFALKEYRPGYVLASLRGGRISLAYKPIGAPAIEAPIPAAPAAPAR
jgi:Icc protein